MSIRSLPMLWFSGTAFIAAWFIGKVILHKGGFIHTLLICGIACYVIQFIQDCRTREYRAAKMNDDG